MLAMLKNLHKRLEKKINDIDSKTEDVDNLLSSKKSPDRKSSSTIISNLPPSTNSSLLSDILRKQRKLYIDIDFELTKNDLIYYTEEDIRRLCISSSLKKDIFQLIHDADTHAEIHRSYSRIVNIVFIFRLFEKLRRYIKHCFSCQLSQIVRHKSYDELISIKSSFYLFHIIIMNFIIDLFDELNVILTVTNKFSRRVLIIVEKNIYIVSQ